MGSKLQQLTQVQYKKLCVNPLSSIFSIQVWSLSMDKNIPPLQNLESAKKMILMHEEIFKGQVQELHQLYDLQKKLMCELENRMRALKETKCHKEAANFELCGWQKAATETGHDFHASTARNCPREVSESCSGGSSCVIPTLEERRGFKTADEEENDVEVELTLSTGQYTTKQRSKSHSHGDFDQSKWTGDTSSTLANKGKEYREEGLFLSSSSGYQENTRRWLMQDLSLGRK